MSRFDLATVAPRLAHAHRQRRIELAAERLERRRMRERLLHAEWLLAHRDLQLARAYHRGNGRYIDRRRKKLERAREEMAALQTQAERLGVQ